MLNFQLRSSDIRIIDVALKAGFFYSDHGYRQAVPFSW